jgi:hypothetical protein
MVRRMLDVIHVTDYAERQVMRLGPAPPDGAYCLARLLLGEHAA